MRHSNIIPISAGVGVVVLGLIGASLLRTPAPQLMDIQAPQIVEKPTPEPTKPEPPAPVGESITLSGIGNPRSLGGERSNPLHLNAGTYKIHVTHDGPGFFSMALNGRAYRDIVGQVGNTDVTVEYTLAEGDYWFGFQADGRWTVTITEPSNE